MSALYLVRHPPVAKAWSTRCYGRSDPGLSRAGQRMVAPLAARLIALRPELVLHSDTIRTRAVARATGLPCAAEPLWRERDFGRWEGRGWNAIYRESGAAMDGMIDAPDRFRPGGGETTAELLERVRRALRRLPGGRRCVVVTHGGPIACARLIADGAPLSTLPSLIPPVASVVRVDLAG